MMLEAIVIIWTCVIFLCSIITIFFKASLQHRGLKMDNKRSEESTKDNTENDTHVKSRRGSCVHAVSNTLSFKRHLSPNAAELPRKLSHRKLFRRTEVGRFLTIRRKSVSMENIKSDSNESFDFGRRKSCFPHVPRRNSLVDDCSQESPPGIRRHSNASIKRSIYNINLPPLIEVTEPEVDHIEPEVTHDKSLLNVRRMSRRKSSLSGLSRRTSRRMSVLRNSPIDIPGIPSKENSDSSIQNISGQTSSSTPVQTLLLVHKNKGLRGALSEFKGVFGPHAHDILMKRRQEYGQIYQFSALGQKIVFLFDHRDLHALRKAEGRYPRHLDFKHLRLYREKKDYPQGLLISHGEEWKKQRRMLSKMMCSAISVANYIPSINEMCPFPTSLFGKSQVNSRLLAFQTSGRCAYNPDKHTIGYLHRKCFMSARVAKKTISYIEDVTRRENYDGHFVPDGITGRYAIEAFGRVLYGHSMNCINDCPDNDMITFVEIARYLCGHILYLELIFPPLSPEITFDEIFSKYENRQNMEDAKKLIVVPTWLLPLHPAWKRHNEQWNVLLKTTMKKVAKFQKNKTFLNRCLLDEVMQNDDMNDGELFINFTDLMLASIDTTSTLIKWCLYELGRNEHVQNQVYEEIRAAFKRTADPFDIAQNMTMLRAVVKETLRLHPVGFMTSRITEKDMHIRSYTIPPRTHVAMSMFVMGRDPEMFPNPEKFDPSRWLIPNKALDKFYNEVPFGFGPRMCIGRRIAEVEVLFFLIHDVQIQPSG